MNKQWKCKVCGYIHEGDTPPETCPLCGVGPDMFEEIILKESPSIKKWECTICGYIHEGTTPPDYCPICGVGPELFRELDDTKTEENKSNFISNEKYNILIVGNGIAGVAAAKAIRERNKNCNITIMSQEKYLTYYRPQLTGLIASAVDENKLYLYDEQWYKDKNINVKLNVNVISINPEERNITLENNEVLYYDKLILANGSDSFIPPVPGNYKKGCFKLRNLRDLEEIKNYIKENNCKKIAIVGGGLLGLEAADELNSHGLKVTIIERNERILNKQLDIDGSKILEKSICDLGIDVIKNSNLLEIVGADKITGIKLSGNHNLDTDLLLFSVGIVPNKVIASNTNLSVNRGILVNEKMETNIENIYACGDVAELNGIVFGTWTSAEKMGTSAGANCLGDNVIFKNFVPSTMLQAFNTQVFSCGTINEESCDKSITFKTKTNNNYGRLFFKNNKLVGSILMGDTSLSRKLIKYIQEEKTINDIINKL